MSGRPGDEIGDENEVEGIERAAGRISELIRSCDLAAPAQGLGRWKIRDIVAHLGGVHRWATRIVSTRSMDGPGSTKSKLDGAELCDWFDAGVADLLSVFRVVGSEEPCPNFNPGSPSTVGWWSRRQLHETTVHRWDVERSLDCTTSIDQATAADGIDEYLDVFVRTRGKQTLTAPLLLTTDGPKRAWTLTPASKPGRLDVAVGATLEGATELGGPPENVLLFLWGRHTMAEAGLTVRGDEAIASSLKAKA